eukprot:comp21137_c0_seq1/m.28589 comp21137_c0_seq1/g.28589  ORF comp21137_c0_seq1/g.28589 comp21137_c0_seq1/m.28589 type:complete len:760 (-) comp21137_c0_seq1:28-2307(-)
MKASTVHYFAGWARFTTLPTVSSYRSVVSCRLLSTIPGGSSDPSKRMDNGLGGSGGPEPFSVLSEGFLADFKDKKPPFGFNGLGELVYRRTYARRKEAGANEEWWETVARVVNGTFNMQRRWCEQNSLEWIHERAVGRAQRMYEKIYEMKFLPPGRGLWAMGSPVTEERGLFAALNNCGFVSTEIMHQRKGKMSKPFCFLMDVAMLGVGVGFDTRGAGWVDHATQRVVPGAAVWGVDTSKPTNIYQIPDSREGWVESLRLLLDSYFEHHPRVEFDYSLVRPAGVRIKGFGGIASGPQPLAELHDSVRQIMEPLSGKTITATAIVDLFNLIGRCVIAGNVRRTAEIAFGDPNSEEYLDLKDYKRNPQRAAHGWASNNTVFARLGMDYTTVVERVVQNGEPGFAWLENMQAYSRMNGVKDYKDRAAMGGNPCLEQTLESFELCCLVETFPHKHETLEDFKDTLDLAFLYAKTVTLANIHWPETNEVMQRNRRIGTSMTGIAQFITNRGLEELREWLEQGYAHLSECDERYSEEFRVCPSKKKTSVKPSGSVSLLAGATPGVHYPHSRFQLRRVRLAAESELVPQLEKAGYHVEPDVVNPGTRVVSFPIDVGVGMRSLRDVSMWEQLHLAAFMQKYWADNQVSCTVTFDPVTEGPQIKHALNYFQYMLKGISFLPRLEGGAYAQMPIEEITETQYKGMISTLKPLSFGHVSNHVVPERFCDGDQCQIEPEPSPHAPALDEEAGDFATMHPPTDPPRKPPAPQ